VLIAVAIAFAVGAALALRVANSGWIAKASLRYGRVLCRGRFFWVVDAGDPDCCRALIELLTEEEHRRENAAKVARMREGAAP
jgi:hypothetical protein